MSKYVIRRLLQAVPTFLGITLIVFVIVYSAPGDPILQLTFTEKAVTLPKEQLRHLMGLDKPIPVQYLTWLIGNDWMRDPTLQVRHGILRGDFGISFIEKRPVANMFGERLGPTLLLMVTATLIGYVVGIPVGVLSAVMRGRPFDNVSRVLAVILNAVPMFWLSLIVILIFSVRFKQLGLPHIPSGGMYTITLAGLAGVTLGDRLLHLLPPALVLATVPMARVSRLMRTQVLEVMRQDYVRTARAKGLSNHRVYFTHALRNALIPLATILGPTLTGLVSGSIIAETIWSWPGLGRLTIQATFQRDYPVIMAGLVFGALAVILGNLISDILYGVFDPRVSLR
jgi:peptide/nickel transport system permease protein